MPVNSAPNITGMVSDPAFQGLSPSDKRDALSKLTGDASFSGLSDADTMSFVTRVAPPSVPKPQLPGALNPAFNASDNAMALAAGQNKTPSGFPVVRGETGSLGPTEAAKTTGEAALQTASGIIPGPATGEALTAGANAGARALTPHVVRVGQWAAEHPVAAKALYTVVKDSALGGGALYLLKKGLDIGLAGK